MKIERKRTQLTFAKPSRTKQAFKDECDINKILSKFEKTQQLTHVNKIKGEYGDFSNVTDYQSALNAVMDAQEKFMGLPSSVRQVFANDPSNLLSFISDDKNYEKAAELGLLDSEKLLKYQEQKLASLQNDDKTTNSGS